MSITCPVCGMTSHHPKDEEFGYCGNCHEFTGSVPAITWIELRRAADQMAVAKWREAHPVADLRIPDHTDLVTWLLDQLATSRRVERVDNSLAKQLGHSIARNSKLNARLADVREHIEQWLASYPLDIFPEPDLDKAAGLLKAGGQTLDAVSANMGRHVLKTLLAFMDQLQGE